MRRGRGLSAIKQIQTHKNIKINSGMMDKTG
jgi:hypothetical protein